MCTVAATSMVVDVVVLVVAVVRGSGGLIVGGADASHTMSVVAVAAAPATATLSVLTTV